MKIYEILLKYSECNCYNKYIKKNNEKYKLFVNFKLKFLYKVSFHYIRVLYSMDLGIIF